MSLSILSGELLQYYAGIEAEETSEELTERLESLNTDYEVLLEQFEKDPELIKRVAAATLGTRSEETNTVYPKVAPEQLDAARKALTEALNERSAGPAIPRWLVRCSEPNRRVVLFFAGGFLILISFIWFVSFRQVGQDK